MEVAKPFNDFYSNIVKNLEISEYKDDLHNRLSSNPALQAIQALTLFCSFLNVIQAFIFHQ